MPKACKLQWVMSVAMLGSLLAMTPATSQAETLRMSTVTSVSAKDASYELKRLVEERSGGDLEITIFPDNQLGDDRVVVESTIFGDIDIGLSSTSPMATLFPDLYLFDAPFLFLSKEGAYVELDGEVGDQLLASLESKGLKGLAFWENGFRNFTDSGKVVAVPADVEGMKVRTMENEVHLAAWRAYGANPTPMAFTELFTALQQGTVDAQENPLGIIDGNRLQEVQDHVSLTQHVYTPYLVFMNLSAYNALSQDQRDVLEAAIDEMTTYQRQRSEELEGEILAKFSEQGVTVTELSPEQKAMWRDAAVEADIYALVKDKMEHPEYLDQLLSQ
ncbi:MULTISPECIES: DctP family TRAP transporter solute-binding subunit [Halomonas]|uniref:DctP family TRAP transporter solute-binding subunit n=1 Tax=Halomonas TaxID=2745 RepID=UPI001C972683|nr:MULTISPECIES: DctP family TRAP transporter solute-binding subunit [Halomonas]MBY6206651.1 DctP family TRAP transporter solute-binding subunit [Halomonas sp. DP3Y7-2]MBY6230182.1 DctP family TRAP transporter solute-binding subunit [Halomonas sp. DP3Y7-1]MCA0918312.1 DctP family TRAP transporter solute-binding subunit [Halomonas denitrificans]